MSKFIQFLNTEDCSILSNFSKNGEEFWTSYDPNIIFDFCANPFVIDGVSFDIRFFERGKLLKNLQVIRKIVNKKSAAKFNEEVLLINQIYLSQKKAPMLSVFLYYDSKIKRNRKAFSLYSSKVFLSIFGWQVNFCRLTSSLRTDLEFIGFIARFFYRAILLSENSLQLTGLRRMELIEYGYFPYFDRHSYSLVRLNKNQFESIMALAKG